MKIIDIINSEEVTLSFEVFPPKNNGQYDNVVKAAMDVAALHTD